MFFLRWLLSSTHNSSSAPTEALCLRLRWRWGEGCHSAVSSCSCGRRAAPADPRSYSASPHLPASRCSPAAASDNNKTISDMYEATLSIYIWPRPCYCCCCRLLTFIRANPGICRSQSALPCIAGHCRHLHLYSVRCPMHRRENHIYYSQHKQSDSLYSDCTMTPIQCRLAVNLKYSGTGR